MSRTTDPLGDAITVLESVRIEASSERPDTEDALNRVVLAVGYLRQANEIMRSLAKDNYVQAVILKLGDFDRAELKEARKVVDAARAYTNDISSTEAKLALHVAVECFDLFERSTRYAHEPLRELLCPQLSPHEAHNWQGAEGPIRCPGRLA